MSSNVSDILDPCDCSTSVNVTHEKEPCDSWEYDTSVVESTLVTQVREESMQSNMVIMYKLKQIKAV